MIKLIVCINSASVSVAINLNNCCAGLIAFQARTYCTCTFYCVQMFLFQTTKMLNNITLTDIFYFSLKT